MEWKYFLIRNDNYHAAKLVVMLSHDSNAEIFPQLSPSFDFSQWRTYGEN